MNTTRNTVNRPPPLIISNTNSFTSFEKYSEFDKIRNIDAAVSVKMFDYDRACNVARESAIEMHNQWRKTFIKFFGNVSWLKKNKEGVDVDINVDGKLLDLEFMEVDYNMALFTATYLIFYKYATSEECASIIHRKWIIINPQYKGGLLDVSYNSLPKNQKQKYMDIYNIVYGILNRCVNND